MATSFDDLSDKPTAVEPQGQKVSFDALADKPSAPTPPPNLDPQDLATSAELEKRLIAQGVDPETAARRAKESEALVREMTGTRVNPEFQDGGSAFLTGMEGIARGFLPIDVIGAAEGAMGSVLERLGWQDNPFTFENIKGRREANPVTAGIGEVGGVIASLGSSAIAKGGAKLAEKGAERILAQGAERSLASAGQRLLGLGQKAVGVTTEAAGRFADLPVVAAQKVTGKLLPRVVGRGAGELTDLATRELQVLDSAADDALSAAEKTIRDTYRARVQPTAVDKAVSILGKTTGGKLAGKTGAEVAERAAVSDRARQLLTAQTERTFDSLGVGGKIGTVLVSTLSNAAAGAGVGAGKALSNEFMTRQALSPEQVASIGEGYGTALLNGAKEGGEFGALIGTGVGLIPYAIKVGAATLRGLNRAYAKTVVAEATRIGGEKPAEFRAAVTGRDVSAARTESDKTILEKMKNTLEFQYENAEQYVDNLDTLANDLADEISNITGVRPSTPTLSTIPRNTLDAMRNKFMSETSAGVWEVDKKKLKEAFSTAKITYDPVTGAPELELPAELQALENIISDAEADVAAFYVNQRRLAGATETDETLVQHLYPGLYAAEPRLAPPNIFPETRFAYKQEPSMYDLEGLRLGQNRGALAGTNPLGQRVLSEADVAKFERLRLGDNPLFQQLGETFASAALFKMFAETGLIPSFAYGYLTNGLIKAAINPADALRAYENVQRLSQVVSQGASKLSRHLVLGEKYLPSARGLPVQLGGEQISLYTGADKDKKGFTAKEVSRGDTEYSRGLYDADKALFEKLKGTMGAEEYKKLLGSDYDAVNELFPNLTDAASTMLPSAISYLEEKMKAIVPSGKEPTSRQLYEYGTYARYVRDPDAIFDDISRKGYVPSQALDVLSRVYPSRYKQLKLQLLTDMQEAAAAGQKINPKQMAMINLILGSGLKQDFTSAQIKKIQDSLTATTVKRGGNVPNERRVQLERSGTTLEK